MPNADEILKHKLAGLTDEQRGKLAEMLLAEADEMVEGARHNFVRSYTAQLKRENERLKELFSKSNETDDRNQ